MRRDKTNGVLGRELVGDEAGTEVGSNRTYQISTGVSASLKLESIGQIIRACVNAKLVQIEVGHILFPGTSD